MVALEILNRLELLEYWNMKKEAENMFGVVFVEVNLKRMIIYGKNFIKVAKTRK